MASLKIPAILILNKNKTYGRSSNGRLLYKAIPSDTTIPAVLVPYTIKSAFSKAYVNMYVLLEPWDNIQSQTLIADIIGPVDILDNTYTFELHCKGLWLSHPPAFKRPYSLPIFKTDNNATIFSIDGPQTRDFDDAFSIRHRNDSDVTEITIYIANVPLILAHMGLLTELIAGQKMSSIYLPNKVVPLLPARFSEGICSLCADGTVKSCFKLLIGIDNEGFILYYSFNTEDVIITHNYVYETDELLSSPDYKLLVETTRKVFNYAAFSNKSEGLTRTFNFMSCPQKSDEIVAYWMIMMNWIASHDANRNHSKSYTQIYRADELIAKRTSATTIPIPIPGLLEHDVEKAIGRHYGITDEKQFIGEYTTEPRPHTTLNIPTYLHITSPIRRMPDIINIAIHMLREEYILCKLSSNVFKQFTAALDIYQSTKDDFVNRLNTQMLNIKRVQRQCELFAAAVAINNTRRQYNAVLCNMVDVEKGEWEIYIPDLRLFTFVIIPSVEIHTVIHCELYSFYDETTTRKFVKVNPILSAS